MLVDIPNDMICVIRSSGKDSASLIGISDKGVPFMLQGESWLQIYVGRLNTWKKRLAKAAALICVAKKILDK